MSSAAFTHTDKARSRSQSQHVSSTCNSLISVRMDMDVAQVCRRVCEWCLCVGVIVCMCGDGCVACTVCASSGLHCPQVTPTGIFLLLLLPAADDCGACLATGRPTTSASRMVCLLCSAAFNWLWFRLVTTRDFRPFTCWLINSLTGWLSDWLVGRLVRFGCLDWWATHTQFQIFLKQTAEATYDAWCWGYYIVSYANSFTLIARPCGSQANATRSCQHFNLLLTYIHDFIHGYNSFEFSFSVISCFC